MPTFNEIKREQLQKDIALKTKQYQEVKARLRGNLNPTDKIALEEEEQQLETEIGRLEDELRSLPMTHSPADLLTPSTIIKDKYLLDEVIDEGGNGQVWRGRERLPDGHVQRIAIKMLKPAISADPRRVERFMKEISAARRLSHPHILRALDYGLHQGQFFVVMDFIDGKSLRRQLQGKQLPIELTIRWLGQIASALSEAHRHNIIHRDIKPENILYSRKGETDHLYLTDFGLIYSSDFEQNITEEGDIVGTGRYMSPEQCNPDHAEVSIRSDVYSLGIMAYEMLTGSLPFTGANKVVLCQHHLMTPLPKSPVLPASLFRILEKATAKRPDERYASMQAFMDDLQRWQDDPANLEPVILSYIEALEKRLRTMVLDRFVELSGDEQTLRGRVEQSMAAIDLLAGFGDYDDFFRMICAPVEADHVHASTRLTEYVPNVRERLMMLERAVLVGEPGAGKTWMLFRLALAYCSAYKQNAVQGIIPILVPLNTYRGEQPFADFVRERAGGLGAHLDGLLRRGRVVVLCDALNEMPKAHLDAVRDFLKTVRRFVVSCRVRDYHDELQALNPLEQVILRDMELDAIYEFIRLRLGETRGEALWQAMGASEKLLSFWRKVNEAGEGEHFFWDSGTSNFSFNINKPYTYDSEGQQAWRTMHKTGLIPLARNPFTAQMLCGIYETEGVLQKNRAALFGRFVISLLERERRNAERQGLVFPAVSDIEIALVALAGALQTRQQTVIGREEARASVDRPDVDLLFKAATDANILLVDSDNLKFAHQLLQEYFAVRVLVKAMSQPADEFFPQRLEHWWDLGVWKETIVILGEFLGGRTGANAAARWLAPYNPEEALNIILRSGAGLTLADVEDDIRGSLIQEARAKASDLNPVERALAYRILGLFNEDHRPGIGVLPHGIPDITWVTVPVGEFTYGDDDRASYPYPNSLRVPGRQQILYLPTFEISQYLITYAQYQAFIDDAEGFYNPLWWKGLADTDDRQANQSAPGEQANKYGNHPRDYVSWYDAVAFCRWLTAKLGYEIRLPTEFEWEKAARGTDGRPYSYGNEFSPTRQNMKETGIGQTSAVGLFPEGSSPYGIQDMSGNIWEWCLTDFRNPVFLASREDLTSSTERVTRGGGWSEPKGYMRAPYRDDRPPYIRVNFIGFRICRPHVP